MDMSTLTRRSWGWWPWLWSGAQGTEQGIGCKMKISMQEAKRMCSDPYSGFSLVPGVERMSLPPKFQSCIGQGVRDQLDSRLGYMCEKYNGVIIQYLNVRLLGDKGRIVDDSPFIHIEVSVDFIVFQPCVGYTLQGVVNKLGKDHIGLVTHGHFNVSVRLTGRPEEKAVCKGDACKFTIVRVHTHRNLLSIIGKLATE